MKQFILAAAASAALSACVPQIQLAGLPSAINHYEACYEGEPDSDCFTVVPEYCKDEEGNTWAQYRNWTTGGRGAHWSVHLLLRGEDSAEFLRKFGSAGDLSFPAGAEVMIFKHGKDYADKEPMVIVSAQDCFVKGMVDVSWSVEDIKPHLSHIPYKELPAFLR